MWFVECETIDGEVRRSAPYEDSSEAELTMERLHLRHSGGGVWAVFRVVWENGQILSEMWCGRIRRG